MCWILLALLINGIISFAYGASTAADKPATWAMMATTYVFFLGLGQTGIIFSTIMRIAKSEWARYFSRLGEIITLSTIPVAFVSFLVVYFGGTEHIFWWAKPAVEAAAGHGGGHGEAHHISPWLGKGLFFWRTVISMALFYFVSYIYFINARVEEKTGGNRSLEIKLNWLAGIVMFFYVFTNTNTAWDFGMMLIQHWESTIFPAYFWVGNVFAGVAFLFIFGSWSLSRWANIKIEKDKETLEYMGIMLMGFTLLWIYMHWSQHIVIWYGDMPNLVGPMKARMFGNYSGAFTIMLFAIFIIPFVALLFRKIKLSLQSLLAIAFIICIGVWFNRYLMIIPEFSDGTKLTFFSWTGISLILGGLSALLLSVITFRRLFPDVTIHTHTGHHGEH